MWFEKLNWYRRIGTKIGVLTAALAFLFMSVYTFVCIGILRSQMPGEAMRMDELPLGTEIELLLIGLVTALALASILLAFMSRLVTQPMQQIMEGASRAAQGNLDFQIPIRSENEIGILARSVSEMARELRQAKEYVEQWGNRLEQCVADRTREMEAAQKQLIRSEKLASLGKLAAGVAHEINNPLTGILTFSQLLMDQFPPDSDQHHDLKIIVQETIRCRTIVRGLLEFARQTAPERRPVRVEALLEDVLNFVAKQESFRNMHVEKDFAPDIPSIMADADQIKQVFLNIAVNASEAMADGGVLHVRTRFIPDRSQATVEFEDTGPGIAPDQLDKLFDPFFTTKEMGTGLGLAVSYGIIKTHRGNIEIKSKQGEGTQVLITLPVETIAGEENAGQAREALTI